MNNKTIKLHWRALLKYQTGQIKLLKQSNHPSFDSLFFFFCLSQASPITAEAITIDDSQHKTSINSRITLRLHLPQYDFLLDYKQLVQQYMKSATAKVRWYNSKQRGDECMLSGEVLQSMYC